MGCSMMIARQEIEPTDLSSIKVGADRETVERLLGPPADVEMTDFGSVEVYEYQRLRVPPAELSGKYIADYFGYYGWVYEPILFPLAMHQKSKKAEETKGTLVVGYSQNDEILYYRLETLSPKILRGVREGDAEAEYRYASTRLNNAEKWKWFCKAANKGHPGAMFQFGARSRPGTGTSKEDLVRAYMWYSLAFKHGNVYGANMRDQVAPQMTAPEIAEAERLVDEWQPDEAECEVSAIPSGN
jgi:TPR repeat protein